MNMKTPEQVAAAKAAAQSVIDANGLEQEDGENPLAALGWAMGGQMEYEDALIRFAAAAIKADRAQRAVITPGHSADDIAEEAADFLGIDYSAYQPNHEQVFSMCYEAASLAIDAVRAADRAQRERSVVVVRESMAFGHDDEVDIVDLDFIGSWPDAHGDFDQDDIDRMLATLERGEFHSAADDLREWWNER